MELTNAVGYIRVSTAEQARNSDALNNQRARVVAALPPGAPVFEDICSGTKTSRPGFNQMLEVLKSGRYTHVVITRPDRLGRNSRTGFQQIIDWEVGKDGHKIKCVSLDVPIDLDRIGGRFNLALLSEAAIFEVDMLSQRIRKSKELNMLSGAYHHKPPFGYLCVDGLLVPDEEKRHCPLGAKPADTSKVFEGYSNADLYRLTVEAFIKIGNYAVAMRSLLKYSLTSSPGTDGRKRNGFYYDNLTTGRTIYVTKPCFPPASNTSLKRYLFSPSYRGHRCHRRNWDEALRPANGEKRNMGVLRGSDDTYEILHQNTHLPLLTESQWTKIRVLESRDKAFEIGREKRPTGCHSPKLTRPRLYPLSGLLFCSDCNRALKVQPGRENTPYSYYRCRTIDCKQFGMTVRNDRAAIALCMHLQQKAVRVQSGEETLPEPSVNSKAQEASLQRTLDHLMQCPDPSFVSRQIQDIRRQIEALQGKACNNDNLLQGNARQILLSPKAADWGHWTEFLGDIDNLLYRMPLIVSKASIGFACEEDRPIKTPGRKGRPRKDSCGKASVLSVELR